MVAAAAAALEFDDTVQHLLRGSLFDGTSMAVLFAELVTDESLAAARVRLHVFAASRELQALQQVTASAYWQLDRVLARMHGARRALPGRASFPAGRARRLKHTWADPRPAHLAAARQAQQAARLASRIVHTRQPGHVFHQQLRALPPSFSITASVPHQT